MAKVLLRLHFLSILDPYVVDPYVVDPYVVDPYVVDPYVVVFLSPGIHNVPRKPVI